jgi:hypothetical protein
VADTTPARRSPALNTTAATLTHPGLHVQTAPTTRVRAGIAQMLFRSAVRKLPLNVIGPRSEAISRGPAGP